jgi:hypothetical protein
VTPGAHRTLGNRTEQADLVAEIDGEALDASRLLAGVGLHERGRPRLGRIGRIAQTVAGPARGDG